MAGKLLPVALAFVLGFFIAMLYFQNQQQQQQLQQQQHLDDQQSPLRSGSHQSSGRSKDDDMPTFLAVIIFSAAKNVNRRKAIRETWLRFADTRRVEHFFVIGTAGLKVDSIEALNSEHQHNKDLLLLPYLKDSYSGLTAKLLEAFKWIAQQHQFEFLLKVDDDSFVRLDALYDEMVEKDRATKSEAHSTLYWGYFDGRAHVKRTGQWTESDWFLCDRYLPYALGGGYVLSRRLVDYVVTSAPFLQHYKSEDVSLGVWLSPLAINRVHETRFDTEFKSRGCIDTYLISHKQSVAEMKAKYDSLVTQGRLCASGESEVKLAYEYNWKVQPSKCCVRNVTMIS